MEVAMLGKGVLREACLLPRLKPHVLAGEGWCPLASIVGWGVSWMLCLGADSQRQAPVLRSWTPAEKHWRPEKPT